MNYLKKILFVGFLAQFPISGFAGYPAQGILQNQPAPALNEVNFLVDQTFQSSFKDGHGYNPAYQFNNVTNTWHYDVNAARWFPLGDGWRFKGGFEAARYDFGDNRSIAPNILQSYAAVLGWEHSTGGRVDFSLKTSPGLYFSHRLDGRDLDVPTVGTFFYPVSREVSLMAGARLAMQSHYPVIPLAGVLWHIDENWDLQACLPDPRLIYHYSDRLEFWSGGDLTGGSFRYDDHGKVDYYELRTGAGMDYQINRNLNAKLETGCALVRNYRLSHYTAETQPAPYLTASLGAVF